MVKIAAKKEPTQLAIEDLQMASSASESENSESTHSSTNSNKSNKLFFPKQMRYFLTTRMLIAVLMSSCFMALAVTTTNLSGSVVCMLAEEGSRSGRTKRFVII